LFEQLTVENIERARLSVITAVERWMPFLELVQFELNAADTDIDRNRIRLYVAYRLRQNPNIFDSIVINF
jgi:hypothetical protein